MGKDKYYILGIAALIGIISYFLSGAVFLFLVFGLICYFIHKNSPPEDRKFILTVLIVGFLLRVILALALHAASYVEGYEGFTSGDDLLYSLRSWALVYKWEGMPYIWAKKFAPTLGQGLNPFTYLLALFYKLFGFHPATAKIINCIMGSLIGWTAYLIGREVFDGKAAKISLAIVTFYPSLVRWSVANLQDSVIILLFMTCSYILIAALDHKIKIVQLVLLVIWICVLYYFINKYYLLLVLFGVGMVAIFRFLYFFNDKRKIKIFSILVICLTVVGISYYFLCVKPQSLLQYIYMCEITQRRLALSDYAGYYLYTREFLELINKGVIYLPQLLNIIFRNVVYFMLKPFPWDISSKGQLMAFPQMLSWYLLLTLSIFGFAKLFIQKPKIAFFLAILLVVGITVRSLVEGNIGAAFRHRDIFTPFFVIFASTTIRDLINDKKRCIEGIEK